MNRKQLRRMIMSAINEHRVAPAPHGIPPQHLNKIHRLIDAGEIEQAQSLIDGLGGDPNYVDKYIAYEEVGDMEKLGNRAADILPDSRYDFDHDFMKPDDRKKVRALDREAFALSQDKASEFEDGQEYYNPDAQTSALDRYRLNRNINMDSRIGSDVFLFEHRVAPVPPNIPQNHLNKIHSLIDSGRLEQAQSLIDAFGGDPSYVDKYIAYEEVGDMEKLGNRAFDIYHSGMSDLDKSTALKDIDIQAINISDERGRRLYGGDQSYIDGGGFTTDMDRYIDNRNRRPDDVLFEHRVLPEPYGIPPQHLDKIHDLINTGELEQAQTLVDAFAGDPDYVYKYRDYEEAGDMEKLGNRAYDARSTYDRDSLELTSALEDISREAISVADKRGRRLDGDDHSYFFPGSFQTDIGRYLANRDRPLSEHRIAPSLNLPGVPQSHVDKIHSLIHAGELEQAQSLIDAFGGPSNYARDYQMYYEVGDLEKLGNKAADVYHSLPKDDKYGWASPDDLSQVYAIDREAYRLGIDKVARGTMPVQPGDVSGANPHHAHMRDRYYNNRNSIPVDFDEGENPLNEGMKALRRMILNELTMLQDNTMKVVELSLGAGFTLRHPELAGGEIVVDEMDEVAGALVALKGMGFTHVHSLETGDEPEPIGLAIQYFDDEIGGGRGRYKEYYPGSMNTYPVTTIVDDFDDDDDDDYI